MCLVSEEMDTSSSSLAYFLGKNFNAGCKLIPEIFVHKVEEDGIYNAVNAGEAHSEVIKKINCIQYITVLFPIHQHREYEEVIRGPTD